MDPREQPAQDAPDAQRPDAADDAGHPDRIGTRGNPEVEAEDLERGIGKMERITGN